MAQLTCRDLALGYDGRTVVQHLSFAVSAGEYLLIVGEKEEAEGLVSVRAQGEGDKGQMTLEAFRDYMTDLVSHEIDANKMEQKN